MASPALDAVGEGRADRARAAASRLRRPDRSLLRRRRPAVDVHAVAVSDSSAAGLRRDPVRADVVAADPARRTPAPSRQHPSVAGRLGRALGRRHARRRDEEPERQDLAERSRRRRQPRPDGRRAFHSRERGHHDLPRHGDRSDRVHAAVDDRDSVEPRQDESCSRSPVTRTTRTCIT